MTSEETIKIVQDGIEQTAKLVGTFELENGNEYLLYHLNDDELQVSKIVENAEEIILETVSEADMAIVNEFVKTLLEEG